jgi:integrase
MLFKDFVKVFFNKRNAQVAAKQLATTTLRADKYRITPLQEAFAQLEMRSIPTYQIEEFLDGVVASGKSLATANRYRALISTIFEYALRLGEVHQNPVKNIKVYPEKRTRKVAHFWDAKSRDKYITAAFRVSPEFGIASAIMCLAGPRISECLALVFSDIKWSEDLILVNKIRESDSRQIMHRTKGQKAFGSYRLLMVPRLKKLLKAWKQSNRPHPEDTIITHPDGRPYTYDQYRRFHYQAVYLADVKPIPIHGLRRTFASLAARAGFYATEVSSLLGHETLTCVQAYIKNDASYLVDKAKKLGLGNKK